jgi:hypothetical protein
MTTPFPSGTTRAWCVFGWLWRETPSVYASFPPLPPFVVGLCDLNLHPHVHASPMAQVCYDATSFLEKNRDRLAVDVISMLRDRCDP